MARNILGILLLLIAHSGCAGKPWLARGGQGISQSTPVRPADRQPHGVGSATPGFLPANYRSPNPLPQPQTAQHPASLDRFPGDMPGQRDPSQSSAANHPAAPHTLAAHMAAPSVAAPQLAVLPGATPYTSVYPYPQPSLPPGVEHYLKQTIAEAVRENISAIGLSSANGEPATAQSPSDRDVAADRRGSAFNINDTDSDTSDLIPPPSTPLPADRQAASQQIATAQQSANTTASDVRNQVENKVIPASHTVKQHAAVPPRGHWRDQAITALAALEKELASGNHDPVEKARLNANARLMYAILNDTEKALAPIKEADEDEQEYWKHLTHGLLFSLDADEKNTSSRRSALALRSLRIATDHLANVSTLDLRNLAFCSKVESYGRFDEFKSYGFKPGQEVLLYVEVENFAVDSEGDRHETELQGEYTIFDSAGGRVANAVLPLDKQVSKNRRHDYFIAYRVFLPKKINQGHYTLHLTMEDVKGSKSNQASVEFWIR